MIVKAYAKLNLYLDIIRLREDGYHELDMIMQEVELADILTFTPAAELTVQCPGVPMEKNLTFRAARSFYAAANLREGMLISIEKHIPSEAGMGGGSSDAACVLKTLNKIYGFPLSAEQLTELALALGADVPFALFGKTARAQGIGEILSPIENRLCTHYLIVKPPKGVPTGQAFRLADETPQKSGGNILTCIHALETGDRELFAANTHNALTSPAITLCPEIHTVLSLLKNTDNCTAAFMTGSGSACVGMFRDISAANSAGEQIKNAFPDYFITVTKDRSDENS